MYSFKQVIIASSNGLAPHRTYDDQVHWHIDVSPYLNLLINT